VEELQRDGAAKDGVERTVHLSHAAGAEHLDDAVPSDLVSRP
jgi:hypothetical protein